MNITRSITILLMMLVITVGVSMPLYNLVFQLSKLTTHHVRQTVALANPDMDHLR